MKLAKFAALFLLIALYSCDNSSQEDIMPAGPGTYILNNGNWGSNDSNISVYDPSSKTLYADAFYSANGVHLGDLGQDITGLGENIYIAVNGSQTIFVTDNRLKVKTRINADKNGARLSPKYFATSGSKIYVTYYEGFLGEISDNACVRLCAVGPNPEGIAVAGENLYVANSGGLAYPEYNNTVSVVSTATFEEVSTIEVNVNPIKVEASSDGKYVYISSFGNYADCPAKLQVIDVSTGSVTDLEYASISGMAKGHGDILYILCGGYDENWNPLPGIVYTHDMKTNTPLGTFVTDGTALPDAYSIAVGRDGFIYVGCSDYKNTGDVYVFTASGRLHDKFDSQGMNPLKVY